jgi:hypothetical protein
VVRSVIKTGSHDLRAESISSIKSYLGLWFLLFNDCQMGHMARLCACNAIQNQLVILISHKTTYIRKLAEEFNRRPHVKLFQDFIKALSFYLKELLSKFFLSACCNVKKLNKNLKIHRDEVNFRFDCNFYPNLCLILTFSLCCQYSTHCCFD